MKLSHHGLPQSRHRALAWWYASATVCGASMAWMEMAPTGSAGVTEILPVRLVIGWMGLFVAAGFGVMGFLCWPDRSDVPRHKQESTLSAYDGVTGLPTRRLFLVLFKHALSRAEATNRNVAVLVCVLEQFRPLSMSAAAQNMTLVVRVQAARIKSALRSHDVVTRLDEYTFAVVADNLESPDEARSIAERIQHAIALPLMIEGQELLMSCRIGGVVGPQKRDDAESLLDAASLALSDSPTAAASITLVPNPTTDFLSPSSQNPADRTDHYVGTRH